MLKNIENLEDFPTKSKDILYMISAQQVDLTFWLLAAISGNFQSHLSDISPLGTRKLLEYHAVPVPHDFMKRNLLPICPSSSAMHCTAGANRNAVHICNVGLSVLACSLSCWASMISVCRFEDIRVLH
jgi:hypothetical protein